MTRICVVRNRRRGRKRRIKPFGSQSNVQGDITHILDNADMVVAKYVYDAWGNHVILDANGDWCRFPKEMNFVKTSVGQSEPKKASEKKQF